MAGENELNIDDLNIDNLANNEVPPTNPPADPPADGGGEGGEGGDNQEPVVKDEDTTPAGQEGGEGGEGGAGSESGEEEEVLDVKPDEHGNLVDNEGNIVYKKGTYKVVTDEQGNQSIEVDDTSGLDSVRDHFKNEFGIELLDGENPKEYENSTEGLVAMAMDIGKQLSIKNEEKTFGDYPLAKDFLNHLMAGQTPESFFQISTNFRSIQIPDETDDNKGKLATLYKQLIIENVRQRNNYASADNATKVLIDKEAEDYYNFKKNGGTEREAAIDSQKMLASREAATEQARNARNQQILQQQQEERTQYWDGIKSVVVEQGKIDDFTIPKDIREDFFNYMSADADGQGNTQEYLDAMKEESHNTNLKLALLRFLNFDIGKLVKMQVAEEKAKDVKLIASKKRIRIQGGLPVEKTNTDISGLSINNMIPENK